MSAIPTTESTNQRPRRRHSVVHSQIILRTVDTTHVTSSSAVAKRPRERDASCLSVVRFNSTPRAHFFIISYFGFKFTSAYNSILVCCLRRNVEPCCHTHDSRTTVTVYSARPRLVDLACTQSRTTHHDCL